MVRRVYRNPPIEEAICQVRYAAPVEWTVATPGQLFERFKERYPGKPRVQRPIQANLASGTQEEGPSFSVAPGPARIQLRSGDGRRLLTVGADVAGVVSLRPYEGWEHLKPRFEQDMRDLYGFFGIAEIAGVSARYINRIKIKQVPVNLSDYFHHFAVTAIDSLPFTGGVTGFFYRSELQGSDNTKLALTLASIESEDDTADFLLDIDVIKDESMNLPAAMELIDHLKEQENAVFEALITDQARGLFE